MATPKNFAFDLKKAMESMRTKETPPPPSGASLRDWFAGIALSNVELMKEIAPENRIEESVKIADQLLKALSMPRTPSNANVSSTEKESDFTEQKNDARERVTKPAIRRVRTTDVPCAGTEDDVSRYFGKIWLDSLKSSCDSPKRNVDAGRYSIVPPPRDDKDEETED